MQRLGISFRMKVLVALCFVAAVAQAIDVDWSKVYRMDGLPENIAKTLEEDNQIPEPMDVARIVGGEESHNYTQPFPHQVALFANNSAGIGFCGGSILTTTWVLTAAHCVHAATSVTILFGAEDIVDVYPEFQYSLEASRIIVHEFWDPSVIGYDIALLEVPVDLKWELRVQPIRLPSRAQFNTTFAGFNGTISGWGMDHDSATAISPILRYTSNPILDNIICNIDYWVGLVPHSYVCLSGEDGRSPCTGDEGGPLIVTDVDEFKTLIGVFSFGSGIGCSRGWPSVYVRVASYLDWIYTNTDEAVYIRDE